MRNQQSPLLHFATGLANSLIASNRLICWCAREQSHTRISPDIFSIRLKCQTSNWLNKFQQEARHAQTAYRYDQSS
jgi:hypothetical protein